MVLVSSVGHINGEVLFDVDFARHPYDPWAAYSLSKTANILFAVEGPGPGESRAAVESLPRSSESPGPGRVSSRS